VALSHLVNSPKAVSSPVLREQHHHIGKRYCKGVLCSPSYFAASCARASISIVRQYIEPQHTPD